jgi:hypothetical protein
MRSVCVCVGGGGVIGSMSVMGESGWIRRSTVSTSGEPSITRQVTVAQFCEPFLTGHFHTGLDSGYSDTGTETCTVCRGSSICVGCFQTKTRQPLYVERNADARSRNYSYRRKAISITYLCVWARAWLHDCASACVGARRCECVFKRV